MRYAEDEFNDNYIPTIGYDYKTKTVAREGKQIKIESWDTDGANKLKCNSTPVRDAQGILVIYDITERESFKAVKSWIDFAKEHGNESVKCILVGNKCDLE